MTKRRLVIAGALLGLLTAGYFGSCQALDARLPITQPGLARDMKTTADYFANHIGPNGRFEYLINLDGHEVPKDKYNVVRHGGSIYGLGMYYELSGDPLARETMLKAGGYLLRRHVRTVSRLESTRAVFSLPHEETYDGRPKAKLGGTALGLAGLIKVRGLDTDAVDLKVLQELGNFILFMQLDSGKFRSKYDEKLQFKTDFESLYYPGEAILALTMLYEVDGDPKWLEAATRAIAYLEESRRGVVKLPNDHWLLIGTQKLLGHWDAISDPPITRQKITKHVLAIGQMMMAEQRATSLIPSMTGSFVPNGGTAPCATRLEGLTALYFTLPPDHAARRKLEKSIDGGVRFLMLGHVRSGRGAGGFTRMVRKLPLGRALNDRQAEVRIDYPQHALSALVGYQKIFFGDYNSGDYDADVRHPEDAPL